MLISKKYKFIFIHIYKNAGTSIASALKPYAQSDWQIATNNRWQRAANRFIKKLNFPSPFFDPHPFDSHITAAELIENLGMDYFKSFYSFAIVRNPWDWQVSMYKFMLKDASHQHHEIAKGFNNFDEYIRWRCEYDANYQKDFIYSKSNKLLVDYVGRFENLGNDFKKICDQIGVNAELPKLNVSNTDGYRQFYSEESKELVRKTFEADIDIFGYDF